MSSILRIARSIIDPRADLSSLPGLEEKSWETPARAGSRLRLRHITSNAPLMFGAIIVIGLFFVVLLGPIWAPVNPYIAGQHVVPHLDPETGVWIDPPLSPSAAYPLGTDEFGNDILSMLLYGARNTLIAAAFVTMARVILGLVLGSTAGWNENKAIDRLVMGTSGVIMAVPMIISSMILIYALDIRRGLPVFIVALSIIGWTEIAQYIRSEILVIRKMPYIEGAKAVGSNEPAMVIRHVLPNILPQLLVIIFLEFGAVLLLMGGLAFIGVFIGGGTSTVAGDDTIALTTQVVADVPEWGAMLAGGYRWFTSKPFIVFPPALAFFIAIIGFNTFGEGLRRLIEQTHVNTSFLLKKRMLLIIAAVAAATIYIIGNTGPAPWFAKMANAFSGGGAYDHVQILSQMDGRSPAQAGSSAASVYIAQKFKEYGLLPGWKNSEYINPMRMTLTQPTTQPVLIVHNSEGHLQQSFTHNIDFGFMIEGHGGSGSENLPLTFVGFPEPNSPPGWEDFRGLDLSGRIVLLQEGNAPANFPIEAQLRGARGVLWISAADDDIRSQTQFAFPGVDYMRHPQLPVFRISTPTADIILQTMDTTRSQLFTAAGWSRSGPGWFTRELKGGTVQMDVQLSEPQEIEVPTVLGYLTGSDLSLAGELVVLFAHYDGLGTDPNGTVFPAANHNASGTGILLEIARLWHEQSLDPRRPVLFVAWGAGTLENPGAAEFLDSDASFSHLPSTATLQPRAIFQIDYAGSGGEELLVHPESNPILAELVQETAAELNLPVTSTPTQLIEVETLGEPVEVELVQALATNYNIIQSGAANAYLAWNEAPVAPYLDTFEKIDPEKLKTYGELLALTITKVVRQSRY